MNITVATGKGIRKTKSGGIIQKQKVPAKCAKPCAPVTPIVVLWNVEAVTVLGGKLVNVLRQNTRTSNKFILVEKVNISNILKGKCFAVLLNLHIHRIYESYSS